ncbi:gmp synthase [Fusarium austroafricanum]|uniref:Gmp synthase n=1 Tax=Fusarium austroafricanum TaxID=2364996 RepID=A0A8H4KGS0_9HYPO|nr:gmp synthase [Fusarium austroafricanum]
MSGSKYKDIMKNGWHPEKSGTTFKGQVKGLVGRGKSDDKDRSNHVSVPISQLKDPSSFAPPPKRTGSGLIPAAPKTESAPRKVITSPSNYQDPRASAPEEPGYAEPQEDFEEQPQPRGPYCTNTTGLSTDNLPKPPGRRDGADGRPAQPPSYQSAMTGVGGGRAAPPSLPPRLPPSLPPRLPPSLPPRLPPRTNSGSTVSSSPAPRPAPTGSGLLNQGAVSRLGAAGISVPGFGIGRSSPAADASPSPPPPPRPGVASPPPAPAASHMNELQNRFSKLGTSSNTNSTAPPPPSEGTTWAQKQAALKTASSFQKDPSSVSFSDARAAASTANNFRQRHGEQVAAGAKKVNSLNQKYGLLDKAQSSYSSFQGNQSQGQGENATTGAASPGLASVVGKKKPPPPPPKRKPALIGASATPIDDEPPPIPMATRPQF